MWNIRAFFAPLCIDPTTPNFNRSGPTKACPLMSFCLHQVSSPSHAGPIRHASYRHPPSGHSAPYRQTGAWPVRQGHVFVSIDLIILIHSPIPCLQRENRFFTPSVSHSSRKQEVKQQKEPKKPVIKKPLNAFMLYMKEMRAKVIAECTLKESAAINQILGRRVRDLHTHTQIHYNSQYTHVEHVGGGGVKPAAVLIKTLKQEQASRKTTTNHGRISVCFSAGFPSCKAPLERHFHVFLQWHALTREEQAKYYELARKERQLHMQLYPTWSARDNYVRIPPPFPPLLHKNHTMPSKIRLHVCY